MCRQNCLNFRLYGKILICSTVVVSVLLFVRYFYRSDTKGMKCLDEYNADRLRVLRPSSCWGKTLKKRWNRFYNETTCRDNPYRQDILKLLTYWVDFAGKHRIQYTLTGGTLLGLVRVNDIIAWDHDIDILIDYKDILRLKAIVENTGTFDMNDGNVHIFLVPEAASQHNTTVDNRTRRSCHGKIVPKLVDSCSFQEPLARVLLHSNFIDLFHFYDQGKQILAIPEGKHYLIKKEDVFPLQRCSVMGVVSLCPRKPLVLLETWYGKGFLDGNDYQCRQGIWQDKHGNVHDIFKTSSSVKNIYILILVCILCIIVGVARKSLRLV